MAEGLDRGLEADVLAATLRQGLEESRDLLEFLALKFEGPLSTLMSVRRKGGLFSKEHPVEELVIRFEERHFQMTREPQGFLSAKILKSVRGIVLKTSKVGEEDWLRELAAELALQAERSASSREALSRFILG
jgi:hypothetical protein